MVVSRYVSGGMRERGQGRQKRERKRYRHADTLQCQSSTDFFKKGVFQSSLTTSKKTIVLKSEKTQVR